MLLGAAVHKERKIKTRANIISKETARIRRVIIGILPCVKIAKLTRDANSAISAYSSTPRLTVSPLKSLRRVMTRIGSLMKEVETFWVVYSRIQSRRNPRRFHGRAKNHWDQIARPILKRYVTPRRNSGKEVHRRVNLTSVLLMLQNPRIQQRKKPCNNNNAPAEKHGG